MPCSCCGSGNIAPRTDGMFDCYTCGESFQLSATSAAASSQGPAEKKRKEAPRDLFDLVRTADGVIPFDHLRVCACGECDQVRSCYFSRDNRVLCHPCQVRIEDAKDKKKPRKEETPAASVACRGKEACSVCKMPYLTLSTPKGRMCMQCLFAAVARRQLQITEVAK